MLLQRLNSIMIDKNLTLCIFRKKEKNEKNIVLHVYFCQIFYLVFLNYKKIIDYTDSTCI